MVAMRPVLPNLFLPSPRTLSLRGWSALGFLYWLALVCALEPGNLAHASAPPPVLGEIARLLAAGVLGGAATPALLALAGPTGRRPAGLLVRALGVAGLAFVLIVTSCLVAAWAFEQRWLPSLSDIADQLSANFVLLLFGLSVFLALIAATRARQARDTPPARTLVIRERGRAEIVALRDIEWIQSQGNYQALRAGGETRLVRRTLDDLEAELDPALFVRIHRRAIVAIDFVRGVDALTNGDALVRMAGGETLRLSRSRRAELLTRLSS